MKCKAILLVLLILTSVILSAGTGVYAAARTWPSSPGFDLKQVALFKNGLGFFVAEVACPARRTDLRVVLPVTPAHGTLWISYAPDIELASVVAREAEVVETRDAVTIRELLEANQGRRVKLTLGEEEVSGVVMHVARSRDVVPVDPYTPGGRGGQQPDGSRMVGWTQAGLAMIQTNAGMLCIDPRAVTRILFAEDRIEQKFAHPVKKVELDIHLSRPAAGKTLTLTFLAKGITWAPSYMVDISDEQNARLSAKAVILNDACQLDGVEVQLVTGFPHLQFSDIVSPLGMKENLAQFLQALNRGASERGRSAVISNVMTQSVAYGRGGADVAMPAYGTADAGVVAEDLFLYPAGLLELDREEVAYVPLFTESVPYVHVYQWDIPDYVTEEGRYTYAPGPQDSDEGEQEIWHSLRLTNTTKVPWTTAPGETVKVGAILGQDTIRYTPSGGQSTLRITRAVGIKADQIELETDRQRDAFRWRGSAYDRITVEGKLSVLNVLDKAVTLEITKTLSGEVMTVEPQATQEKPAKGLRRINPVTKLTWTIELAPGGEQDLSYTYQVYVR